MYIFQSFIVPPFYIKCADRELYWYIKGNDVQLTGNSKEASVFQMGISKDRSFHITTVATDHPVAICVGKPNYFHRLLGQHNERAIKALPVQKDHPEFRFELRCPPPGNYTDIVSISEAVESGDKLFIKPAITKSDDTALAMHGDNLIDKLIPMQKHMDTHGGKTYHMLWGMHAAVTTK